LGLEFLWGFNSVSGYAGNSDFKWTGGSILDPENSKIYQGKIWFVNENEIKVRGYGGPLDTKSSRSW
jgi:uncharacterized protein (DUF2147 family)